MVDERSLLQRIDAARDLVDALAALLAFCRGHAGQLSDFTQRVAERKRAAEIVGRIRDELPTTYLGKSGKEYIADCLSRGDQVEMARALAVGIDLVIRDRDPRYYNVMCHSRGTRVLKDLDPYPTPEAVLTPMYPGGGFSARPRDAGSVLSVDRVPGLALWNSSAHGFLNVIYDPESGVALDNALGSSVDILTVTPNQNFPIEFSTGETLPTGFFGVSVKDKGRQNEILEESLEYCNEQSIEILVLPELAATNDSDQIIKQALSTSNAGERRPSVVIAGSRHLEEGDRRVNRLSVIYGPKLHVVHHDKVGRYVNGPPETKTSSGLETNLAGDEGIDRSSTLRIHSGIDWSMIPLICADFLDRVVVNAVAELHPRLVIVSAMSEKTSGFELSAGTVSAACQATIVVANGPATWRAPKPTDSVDTPTGGTEQEVMSAPGDVAIAVFALPLADPLEATRRIRPPKSAVAPHRVHFRSSERSTVLLT